MPLYVVLGIKLRSSGIAAVVITEPSLQPPCSHCCKIYLFYVCEYTIAVFRHTRRGHQIPLQRASDPFTDGCELPCGCWELNSGPLEEHSVLFNYRAISPVLIVFKTCMPLEDCYSRILVSTILTLHSSPTAEATERL